MGTMLMIVALIPRNFRPRVISIAPEGDPDRVIGDLLSFGLEFRDNLRGGQAVLPGQLLLAGEVGLARLGKEPHGFFILGDVAGKDLLDGGSGLPGLALPGQLPGELGQLRQRARGSV